jgi:DNA-binding response OmpR family regulator
MRIGIVDDESDILEFMGQVLRACGHTCTPFRRSLDLVSALRRETFDLLVLDWNMPEMSGLDVIEWVQANASPRPPIIMLTSRSDKDDIASALNAGADDFIIKPESATVIQARVEAVLRRTRAPAVTDQHERFGRYLFDRRNAEVTLDGTVITLTAKEFALAHAFFSNLHKPLSRGYLMEKVWQSFAELSTRTLDMHVSRIRAKLQLRSDNGYRLLTVFGYGYRLETC